MLKKLLVLIALLSSFSALACWQVEGSLAVDGETWKINQHYEHKQEFISPMGPFILKMTIDHVDAKTKKVTYIVQEKKGANLVLVTIGSEEVKKGVAKDIYAKGEKGQPNSILTIKLSEI